MSGGELLSTLTATLAMAHVVTYSAQCFYCLSALIHVAMLQDSG